MKETLGIGYPLRTPFLLSLAHALRCSLRLKTARGVTVDPDRLSDYLNDSDTVEELQLQTSYLNGECRILIHAGADLLPGEPFQQIEGLTFSLVRVSISYNQSESCVEVIPSEATQLPACPPDVQTWHHFTKYADGLGYGSLECDLGQCDKLERLIEMFTFSEKVKYDYSVPKAGPLDSLLYVIWHWVCASYSMGFGVRLVPPHKCKNDLFLYENIKGVFKRVWIPRERLILEDKVLEYLKSDVMLLPPSIDKVYHNIEDPDTEFSGYTSDSDISDSEQYWPAIEPLVYIINEVIKKYHTVVPSVNGTFLDEAMWISNKSLECYCTRDVILQIKSASSWHHMVVSSAELLLFPGIHFRGSIQLRAYILEGSLVCLEQLFVNDNLEFIADEADASVKSVREYIENLLEPLEYSGYKNSIFDVALFTKTGKVELVNISALGSLPDNLISIEDVYHYYYTGVCNGIELGGRGKLVIVDGILVVIVGNTNSRPERHAFCPKDVSELRFNAPDDMIDFLRFQTSNS